MSMEIRPCGDRAVTVVLGSVISESVNALVVSFCAALTRAQLPGVMEAVPAYCSVCVHYDPEIMAYERLRTRLLQLSITPAAASAAHHLIEIPVCYGGSCGPDLEQVAAHCGFSPEEVVRRHAAGDYLVYMLGFLPGFAYLGGMDGSIAAPRLAVPRTRIPEGSVGIAGQQTGIYPLESPGGWQLIGRTPLQLFDVRRTPQTLLCAGDRVRFVPIDEPTYQRMKEGTAHV